MFATLFRTAFLYVFIIISMRFMGKRQIGEMQPTEFVITILISELAAIPIQDIDSPISNAVISISMLIILEIILSVITMKSKIARRVVNGKYAVIIKDGIIDQQKMQDVRMTIDDLFEELRLKDVFSLEEVAYAIMENNGKLSVLLRPEHQTVTAGQINAPVTNKGMEALVVSDGKLECEQIKTLKLEEKDIKKEIKKKHTNTKDVFIMTVDRESSYNIVKKDKKRTK